MMDNGMNYIDIYNTKSEPSCIQIKEKLLEETAGPRKECRL